MERALAVGSGDRTIRFFETATGKARRVVRQHADWVQSVAFSPDGRLLVSASRDRTARVFTVASGELEATFSGHDAPLLDAVFFGNSTVISAARGRSVLRLGRGKGETANRSSPDSRVKCSNLP